MLVFDPVSNNDPNIEDLEVRRGALKFDSFEVVSGVAIDFKVLITDFNQEVYVTEDHATAQIQVKTLPAPGKTVSLVGNKSFATKGVIHFSDFLIISDPGFSFELELVIDLDNEVDGSSVFNATQTIKVSVRECVAGE